MNIKINRYDHEGRGIGYLNKKIVFVPNTIVDEEVEIEIIKEKNNYLEGKVIEIIKKSPDRVDSKCPYYDKCGGCSYLHMNIDDERNIKIDNVKNILNKYANLDIEPILIESNNIYNYRNKISLKIVNGKFGYYNEDSHDFINIDNCLIAKESINKIINGNYFKIDNGEIVIRSNYNDEIIIKINTDEEYDIDIDKLKKENKIIGIIVNEKLIYGEDFYYERVNGYLYKVNINSFFQVNLDILDKVFNLLKKDRYETVVDLYCGVGTLGIAINKDKGYGIEIVNEAVIDALKNSKLNNQNNLYMLGDSSKIKEIKDDIDLIIVDPPRSGLNKETLNNVMKRKPNTLIYMSCNPLTLARDLNILKEEYRINDFYVLEMFPRTKHVECICFLERK